ncbi:MAG TPA: hypothetical protein VGH51_02855 [Candidatus Angelobacter sp.]|jgi:hypothetical protein
MPASAEHEFISSCLGDTLQRFSATALFGVKESQRRMFDYSCLLSRDLTRPLVSQVLWSHSSGIEKDLRTLLFDSESLLKVYLVKDEIKNYAKIEEVISSVKSNAQLRAALGGLRIIRVPSDFDADLEQHRGWMKSYIARQVSQDILFNIVFGNLSRRDLEVFAHHGSVIGLRYAILDELSQNPLDHTPTFKAKIGYKTDSTIERALTMLNALNFVKRFPMTKVCFIALKGRLLLDLTKLLLFEVSTRQEWSDGVLALFSALAVSPMQPKELRFVEIQRTPDLILNLLYDAHGAKVHFGRDLLEAVDLQSPQFYSEYKIPDLKDYAKMPGFDKSFLSEPDALFFVK